jgi:hypothetical protein
MPGPFYDMITQGLTPGTSVNLQVAASWLGQTPIIVAKYFDFYFWLGQD